jgi:hypothetical protein
MKLLPRQLPDCGVIDASPPMQVACLLLCQCRHVDEHNKSGDGADAWYAAQYVEAGLASSLLGLAVEVVDPRLDLLEVC